MLTQSHPARNKPAMVKMKLENVSDFRQDPGTIEKKRKKSLTSRK